MKTDNPHNPDKRQTVVLVLGMHRSGTSALTRLVSLAGAALPLELLPGNPTNPSGHWEPNRIVQIHDELLGTIGSSWEDWRRIDPLWFESEAARHFSDRLQSVLLEEFGEAPLLVMKDPRTCRLLPLWVRALSAAKFRAVAMLIVRNPLEVARSLGARDKCSVEHSFLLWLRHVLEAEFGSRRLVRCVTSYERLLSDWPSVLDSAEKEFGLTWPRRPQDIAAEVSHFISTDLHRSRATESEFQARAKNFLWIADAYSAMEELIRDPAKAAPRQKLDHVRASFERAVTVFAPLAADEAAVRKELGAWQGTVDTLQRELKVRRDEVERLRELAEAARRKADGLELEVNIFRRVVAVQSTMLGDLLEMPAPSNDVVRTNDQLHPWKEERLDAFERIDTRKRPRFLVVTDAVPTPDLDAGSFRLFHILKLLTEGGFRVTFVSHSEEPRADYAEQLRSLGITVIYGPDATVGHLETEGERYAFVMLSRPEVAFAYLFPVRAYAIHARVAFDTVDLHWVRMQRAAELTGDTKLFEEAECYKRMELFSAAGSDLVLAVTEVEKATLLEQNADLRVGILPTIHPAVDTGGPWRTRRGLMFIGGFWHQPNEDGVCYFVADILPLIRREIPDVAFHIVGSHMSKRVQALASSSVHAWGYVPDPTSYFTESRVFVSPLRYGAGMKGKIGQSMSHGLPVVTTSIGAEGLRLVDGENALIADDAASFARAVVRLYTDERLWESIARRSVSHISEHFSSEATLRRLTALFPIESQTACEEPPVYAD